MILHARVFSPLIGPLYQSVLQRGFNRIASDAAMFCPFSGLLALSALITEGRVHESRIARSLRFEPGTIVVFDRGHTRYLGHPFTKK